MNIRKIFDPVFGGTEMKTRIHTDQNDPFFTVEEWYESQTAKSGWRIVAQFVILEEAKRCYPQAEVHPHCINEPCDEEDCQECCPHDEHDHGICLGCEKDITDDLIGRAEDAADMRADR